jgi:hypothetical protein
MAMIIKSLKDLFFFQYREKKITGRKLEKSSKRKKRFSIVLVFAKYRKPFAKK